MGLFLKEKLLDKRDDLLHYINDNLKLSGYGIEIGVQTSAFSDYILGIWKRCDKLYLMDCWQEQENYDDGANVSNKEQEALYHAVLTKFNNNNRVEVIRDFSPQGASRFQDNYFNFIYIDADHSYNAVKKDLEAWYPKLKKGGVFSGHDYGMDGYWDKWGIKGEFGVTKAVTEFAEKNKLTIFNTREFVCKTWWCIK